MVQIIRTVASALILFLTLLPALQPTQGLFTDFPPQFNPVCPSHPLSESCRDLSEMAVSFLWSHSFTPSCLLCFISFVTFCLHNPIRQTANSFRASSSLFYLQWRCLLNTGRTLGTEAWSQQTAVLLLLLWSCVCHYSY